jgi:hypothetical protein
MDSNAAQAISTSLTRNSGGTIIIFDRISARIRLHP